MKIYQKRKFIIPYLFGCLAFVGMSVFLIFMHEYIISTLSLIFFGLICLPLYIRDFLNPKLVIEINECGFITKEYGFVEWVNVSDLGIVRIQKSKFIGFNLKEEIKLSKSQHMFDKANEKIIEYRHNINLVGTGENINKVYVEMLKHVQKIKSNVLKAQCK